MRMFQYKGFSTRAQEFLKAKGEQYQLVSYKVYADGRKEQIKEEAGYDQHYTKEKIGYSDMWYGEGVELHEYTLADGSKFYDGVQAQPWASGPVAFMALYYDAENRNPIPGCTWTDKEIQDYLR